jgi:molecular chaperone HtpG
MKEGQGKIYYALGPSKALLAGSPHLEAIKARGFEVLYLTHNIDQWAIEGLPEFEGTPLADAMREDVGEDKPAQDGEAKQEPPAPELEPLLSRAKQVLETYVSDVRASQRLTDSPACLVTPQGGVPAHIERLLRAHQQDLPEQKRILELNPKHAIVQRMQAEHGKAPDSERVREWLELLYDQALLAEGSPLPDPQRFTRRVVALMQDAAST